METAVGQTGNLRGIDPGYLFIAVQKQTAIGSTPKG
jgi:hypothetical protein